MFRFDKIYAEWNGERLIRHVFYWLLWLLFFATVNTNYNTGSFWKWIQVELLVMLVKVPFTYLVLYFLTPKFLLKKKYNQFILGLFFFGAIAGFALTAQYVYVVNPHFFDIHDAPLLTFKYWYKVLDLFYVASLPLVFKLFQRQIDQEKRTQQLVEEKLSAELQILKNQLHPHFLFNTLNNLYGMVLTKDERSPQVVLQLSQLISYMLYECDQPLIGLGKEIDVLNNYIELEKIRHGDRVNVEFKTSGEIEHRKIAPLLIFPFVENAFKHGVSNNDDLSNVSIHVDAGSDVLQLKVRNSVPPGVLETSNIGVPNSGIGLENIKRRLELIYPEKHNLQISKNGYFEVILTVDWEGDELLR